MHIITWLSGQFTVAYSCPSKTTILASIVKIELNSMRLLPIIFFQGERQIFCCRSQKFLRRLSCSKHLLFRLKMIHDADSFNVIFFAIILS